MEKEQTDESLFRPLVSLNSHLAIVADKQEFGGGIEAITVASHSHPLPIRRGTQDDKPNLGIVMAARPLGPEYQFGLFRPRLPQQEVSITRGARFSLAFGVRPLFGPRVGQPPAAAHPHRRELDDPAQQLHHVPAGQGQLAVLAPGDGDGLLDRLLLPLPTQPAVLGAGEPLDPGVGVGEGLLDVGEVGGLEGGVEHAAGHATLAEMDRNPLHDELRELAEVLAASEDPDVIDSREQYAVMYRQERQAAVTLAAIRSMTSGAVYEVVDLDSDPAVVACVERLRDRLRALLAWAKETGRM